jgi:MFS family permease
MEKNIKTYLIGFITSLVLSVILIILINKKAYDPKTGKLNCDNYVLSTYLYILLSFILMGLFSLFYLYINFYESMIKYLMNAGILILLVVVFLYIGLIIGCFVLLKKLDPVNQGILLHLVWFILLLILSITFGITIFIGVSNNTLMVALLLLILITAITGIIGYKYGNSLLPVDFDKYLYWSLLALIGLEILSMLLVKNQKVRDKLTYVFALISLIIFVLLMLSYNNKIRQNAEKCSLDSNPPNYPNESMGLVIKMINVLQDLIVLLGKSKGRK